MKKGRALSSLEVKVLLELCPSVASKLMLDNMVAVPQNPDESIVDLEFPAGISLGGEIVHIADAVFKNSMGEVDGCVLLLGDELGNPRQLDFHSLRKKISLRDLENLELKVSCS